MSSVNSNSLYNSPYKKQGSSVASWKKTPKKVKARVLSSDISKKNQFYNSESIFDQSQSQIMNQYFMRILEE